MISYETLITALRLYKYDTIPNQFILLENMQDAIEELYGTNSKIYAVGYKGITKGNYIYLYLNCDEQNELFEEIKTIVDNSNETEKGFIDMLGESDNQQIALIKIGN